MTSLVRGVRAMFAHVRTALMLWLVNVMLASVTLFPIWWWWSRTALLPETDPLLDRFHVGIFRDLLGTGRKPAQLLLERFDADGLTRRVGDERVLRRRAKTA